MGEYYDFTEQPDYFDRFDRVTELLGGDLWKKILRMIENGQFGDFSWNSANNPLHTFRERAEESSEEWAAPKPTVFVSHSHNDLKRATVLAQKILKVRPKYHVWFDAWDPALIRINQSTVSGRRRAILIALAIEFGLLNSTHLVAVLTARSKGSAWIPYEYARVKPKSFFSILTGALIDRQKPPRYVPEYLQLGNEFAEDQDVLDWL